MSNRNMSRPQNVPTAKCTQPQIVHLTADCLTARCQDRKMFRPPIGNRSLGSSQNSRISYSIFEADQRNRIDSVWKVPNLLKLASGVYYLKT